ncbi:MAG TPA: YdeI/OmpD-associated family protein [Chitinophagales bacterium]|nr:YdeI/OmpD-associated family protein [Chitinophagales bacterium]
MEISKTLYVKNRGQWRAWLEKNHSTENEIWLVYYNKKSGKASMTHSDGVEEALCFGWIDSTRKSIDKDRSAQRFTPRRKNSNLSELNKERVQRLIKSGMMKSAGLDSIRHHFDKRSKELSASTELKKFKLPKDILAELRKDPVVWKNFKKFPEYYQHIRIGFIDNSRNRPEFFRKRLDYFLKMTARNKKYGTIK